MNALSNVENYVVMGRKMIKVSKVLVTLLGATIAQFPAHAFFDDFLGDHLNSNWGVGWLEYHVADSNFTVTKATPDGHENSYGLLQSATGYGNPYDQADFSARIKVSFTEGSQVFLWTLGNFFSSGYGDVQFQLFGYRDVRYLTFVLGGGAEESDTLELEPSRTHELRVDRVDLFLNVYLDGSLFYRTRSRVYRTQNAVTLSYAGSFENAPFSVDYVSMDVVPEPSTALIFIGLLPLLEARRLFLKR